MVFNGRESHCIRAAQLVFCVLVTCRGSKEVSKHVISGVANNLVTQ